MVAKSMKKERLQENLGIFDWELTDEDRFKITRIRQYKKVTVLAILCPEGVPGVDMSEVDVVETVSRRHSDTAAMYATERPLGEALAEAVRRGLLASREEVFVTSKLWCTQCHPQLVLRSLRESLQNLQMEYVDLYLIHWPISLKPGPAVFPVKRDDAVPFDFEGVWRAMEECHRLGLAKAIGVSNFTTSHLHKLLAAATVPPAVNQVEMNPVWQQRKLRGYCAEKGIHVAAYSPLGGQNWSGDGNAVLDSEVLAEIARARGKTVAQVALRWIYEQGVTPIVKSFSKERLKENLGIFDWGLADDDLRKIGQIPQKKIVKAAGIAVLGRGRVHVG
ncbi:NAD(P)H-dependent 6'-deoxychalcone synthase [Triticum urartu]|uniref:3''-deamino-3''-oxonicotianamine reductase n=1 Tax=Triticum urartu TaxID=4572 RepID=M7Y5T3_TRIUA|nr:NAD(P)H-dependent 6'-deoxychalcone synthase [Triticum urartu]